MFMSLNGLGFEEGVLWTQLNFTRVISAVRATAAR